MMKSKSSEDWFRIAAITCFVLFINGCDSRRDDAKSKREAEAVAKISTRDRLRLTLADAAGAGIHLFNLKLIRDDIITLTETEPELAAALLADLDRIEALPKTDHAARATIGKEMYERIRIPQ